MAKPIESYSHDCCHYVLTDFGIVDVSGSAWHDLPSAHEDETRRIPPNSSKAAVGRRWGLQ